MNGGPQAVPTVAQMQQALGSMRLLKLEGTFGLVVKIVDARAVFGAVQYLVRAEAPCTGEAWVSPTRLAIYPSERSE